MTQMMTGAMEALHADGPDRQPASRLQLYGRFAGSWRLEADFSFHDGRREHAEGEALFDRVLQGRAIQDLFIIPARRLRTGPPQPWWRYGPAFRWHDPAVDAWHITFYDRPRSVEMRQLARQSGREIVQAGEDGHGLLRRWRFTEITGASFLWLGEVSWDHGASWTLELRMAATRTGWPHHG